MSEDRKEILLLGGSGLLGHALREVLSASHTVTAPGHDQADITNPDEIAFLLDSQKYDVVINCVAFAKVDHCETQLDKAFAINAKGAGNVAKACREHGARLIHISSDYVFDGRSSFPYKEHDEPSPINVYGASKLEGERLVLDASPKALVVRTAWLFGVARDSFVDRILEQCRTAHENDSATMRVVEDQIGDLTSCDDLARQIEVLLTSELSGILHATSGAATSRYEVSREIVRITGSSLQIQPGDSTDYPTPAERPPYSALSNQKLKNAELYVMSDWRKSLETYVKHKMESWQ